MAEREIIIRLADDTSNGRFSTGIDVAEESIATATITKTASTATKNSTSRQIASQVGMNIANTATGGVAGQISGLATSMATTAGIAMLALNLANKAVNLWREKNRQEQEQQNILLRAGGQYRGNNINMYNVRTNLITGKTTGGKRTIYGRD